MTAAASEHSAVGGHVEPLSPELVLVCPELGRLQSEAAGRAEAAPRAHAPDPISPELVLVCPELAALDAGRIPQWQLPPRQPSPAPQARPTLVAVPAPPPERPRLAPLTRRVAELVALALGLVLVTGVLTLYPERSRPTLQPAAAPNPRPAPENEPRAATATRSSTATTDTAADRTAGSRGRTAPAGPAGARPSPPPSAPERPATPPAPRPAPRAQPRPRRPVVLRSSAPLARQRRAEGRAPLRLAGALRAASVRRYGRVRLVGPLRGSVYYALMADGTEWALGTFVLPQRGTGGQPQVFVRRRGAQWIDRGESRGSLCVVPEPVVRRWGLLPSRTGCRG